MIDWLRRASSEPVVEVAGRALPLAIRRHSRAKRMILRLGEAGKDVCVTIPPWGRTADALAFARSRAGWLEGQLARLPEPACPLDEGQIAYRGQTLAVDWAAGRPRKPMVVDGALHIGGPRDTLARRLQRWLEGEAERVLVDDLAQYCDKAGVAAPPLRLSRTRRRWGSCSSRGVIRINWRLIQAPDHVRRSVVAHEVAHLLHFDHSPAFHACLTQLYGEGIKEADRWLKREGRTLYRQFG